MAEGESRSLTLRPSLSTQHPPRCGAQLSSPSLSNLSNPLAGQHLFETLQSTPSHPYCPRKKRPPPPSPERASLSLVVAVTVVLGESLVVDLERCNPHTLISCLHQSQRVPCKDAPHPHSGQRVGFVLLMVKRMVSCESTGKPVQPMMRVLSCAVRVGECR